MRSLAKQMREQASRAGQQIRQAFRAVAARNSHGALIGVEMEGLAGEAVSGELMQQYGFTSAPLAGAEYICLPIGGNSSHGVVIAVEDARYRLRVVDGEVALYSDEGDHVHLKRGRVIEIVTETLVVKAGTKVSFETPLMETSGDIKAAGEVQDHTRSMQADRDLYNGHVHGSSPPPSPRQ